MPIDIGATGFVGIAFESQSGTYTAPTKFFGVRSEGLTYTQDNQERRLIRGVADPQGWTPGPAHIEGDIEMEVLHDVMPYWLHASRNVVLKTGTGPYTYVTTPFHGAGTAGGRTLSITVVKNGIAFGYTGCVVGSFSWTVDSGVMVGTFSIVGTNEQSVAVPTNPVFSTSIPYGHGSYTMSNPSNVIVLDADAFTFQVEDNATPEFRLSNTRGAQFVRFGDRTATMSMTRDFTDRTEYETFKAVTSRAVQVAAAGVNNSVTVKLFAGFKSDYNIGGLSSQGDLIRSEITYGGAYDPVSSKAYEITIVTPENVT